MKVLIKSNPVLANLFGVLAVALVSVPVIAGERDQAMEQLVDTWGQRLQEKVAIQMEQVVNMETVLRYESRLAQQTSGYMDEVALAVSIEPDPVISLEPKSMMANVDSAGIEVDCDN